MPRARGRLRAGFSTGTAVAGAARAALRFLLTGEVSTVVAVRLPSGIFLPVPVKEVHAAEEGVRASVIKDAGDDPDVTDKAEIQVILRRGSESAQKSLPGSCRRFRNSLERIPTPGIRLVAGEGVGVATKAGLPVRIGEPAVNPVPRMMLVENLAEELSGGRVSEALPPYAKDLRGDPMKAHVFLPFPFQDESMKDLLLEVEVRVPRGVELARHTLNPRLGIMGGISILGTTGLVKPFSHEAYKETIQAELSVATANGCKAIVFSTGGKSERFARNMLKDWPEEGFVQIADFFGFALDESRQRGFEKVVLSVFFGKAIKMAQGHPYTHAHRVSLDLGPLAEQARKAGYSASFCQSLAGANTAREALDLIMAKRAEELIRTVAKGVLGQASRIAGKTTAMRLLLFDYEGSLLLDLEGP
jgi:cobalt-precorrin-5B (C1)-methyltransferase